MTVANKVRSLQSCGSSLTLILRVVTFETVTGVQHLQIHTYSQGNVYCRTECNNDSLLVWC